MSEPSPQRLPDHVVPTAYRLTIDADLDAAAYRGSVEIDIEVRVPESVLRVNAADIDIGHVEVRLPGSTLLPQGVNLAGDLLVIELTQPVGGPVTIAVDFTGSINDQLRGFYRSTYVDDTGNESVIGVTQMEATEARHVFPCFDQPDMKATFEVTLVVDPDHLAISNSAPRNDRLDPHGRRVVSFAPTIRMSTYLVAWVIGPLEATDAVLVDGVPVRVVHRPGRSHLTSYALDVARHALGWFTRYYGVPYPGDKLDLVALPDFASGAMENLGCVTFREVLLLVDPEQATQQELQEVADVINHELAHMWFGDLVTMRWWNGLWLNEAFATFMEIAATDTYRPDWKRWSDFSNSRALALEIDGLASTRAVEYPVVTPADAEDMFDVLTYHKGAAVLRMLEQYLGEQRFRDGVREYLRRHAFDNTDTHDLWDALEGASGEPARQIMDSWIFRGGYPLVEVEQLTPTRIRLTQRQFVYGAAREHATWSVPVRVRDSNDTLSAVLLEDEPVVIDLDGDLVTVNADASGFYRVLSPTGALLDRLTPAERHAHLDDTVALMLAGRLGTDELLDLVHRLKADDDLIVWQRIHQVVDMVDHVVDDNARAGWTSYVGSLIGFALGDLGFEPSDDDDDRRRELRAAVLTIGGTAAGDDAIVAHARRVVRDGALGGSDPSIASAAVVIAARNGDGDDWESLRREAADTDNPQLVERFQRALTMFPDVGLTVRACELCLTDDIRTQDAPFLLRQALRNRIAGPEAWRFIEQNWGVISERLPDSTLHRLLDGVRWLSSPDDADAVAKFIAAHPVPSGTRQVEQHLERLRILTAWRARAVPELASRFSTRPTR